MERLIKKELEWIHIHEKPELGVEVTIGGIDKIETGVLEKKDGKFIWLLIKKGKETYATLDEFPYWAIPRAPIVNW